MQPVNTLPATLQDQQLSAGLVNKGWRPCCGLCVARQGIDAAHVLPAMLHKYSKLLGIANMNCRPHYILPGGECSIAKDSSSCNGADKLAECDSVSLRCNIRAGQAL